MMVDSLLGFVLVVLIEDDTVELVCDANEIDTLLVVIGLEKNEKEASFNESQLNLH